MPDERVIVDTIASVTTGPGAATHDLSAPGGALVQFDGGLTARVDPGHPHAAAFSNALAALHEGRVPVYAEIDPLTQSIRTLRVPLIVTVTSLTALPSGDIDAELEISHGRHVLRQANAQFDAFAAALRGALADRHFLAITENDDHEIIDVRDAPGPFGGQGLPGGSPPSGSSELGAGTADIAAPPCTAFTLPAPNEAHVAAPATGNLVITPQRAAALFQLVNAQSCNPAHPAAPCIPFLYPDDGCWGRAHEMCRLMIANGASPGKIWIYGSLRVRTANNPSCQVTWGWHVAPTVQIATGGASDLYVIDPSMFSGPVADPVWRGAQNDASAVHALTDASVFYRTPAGVVTSDPTYSQTGQVLAQFRAQLMIRSAASGAPPYANCAGIA